MNLELVTLTKLAQESGYSEHALRSKIARGEFAEGVHYVRAPDGRIHFKVKEYQNWVESKNMAKAYKLQFYGKGKDIVQR